LSGFAPNTLRYDAVIGLLPRPARDHAGYRVCGVNVDCLDVGGTAELVGCGLDKIIDLLGV
jgi:hypothetical protein